MAQKVITGGFFITVSFLFLIVITAFLIGCQQPEETVPESPEETEITEDLDDLDELDSLTAELENISFEELDDLELE